MLRYELLCDVISRSLMVCCVVLARGAAWCGAVVRCGMVGQPAGGKSGKRPQARTEASHHVSSHCITSHHIQSHPILVHPSTLHYSTLIYDTLRHTHTHTHNKALTEAYNDTHMHSGSVWNRSMHRDMHGKPTSKPTRQTCAFDSHTFEQSGV